MCLNRKCSMTGAARYSLCFHHLLKAQQVAASAYQACHARYGLNDPRALMSALALALALGLVPGLVKVPARACYAPRAYHAHYSPAPIEAKEAGQAQQRSPKGESDSWDLILKLRSEGRVKGGSLAQFRGGGSAGEVAMPCRRWRIIIG
jgi:hypothetical protein